MTVLLGGIEVTVGWLGVKVINMVHKNIAE